MPTDWDTLVALCDAACTPTSDEVRRVARSILGGDSGCGHGINPPDVDGEDGGGRRGRRQRHWDVEGGRSGWTYH